VAGEVDWIVMKALEKEPGRRYQTAEALAADISRYLNHEPVEAGPPSALYAFRKFVRRRRLEVAAATVVVAALVAVAVVSIYQGQQARRAERAAEIAAAGEREAKEAAQKSEQLAIKRADDAARELSKSNAIADFAETMLNGIGPSVAKGRDTGILKDMLGEAVKNTDSRLEKLPELDILIRAMIGNAFEDLGDYQRAIEVMRPRFDSMRDGPLHDDPERLSAGLRLASLYKETGQWPLAVATFREISDAYDRLGDDASSNAIQAKSGLAKALNLEGKKEESIALYRKTLVRLHELGKDETDPAIEIRIAVAAALLIDGKLDQATPEFELLVPLSQRLYGLEHPATIAVLTNLAQCYLQAGQMDRAIEMNQKVVETVRKIYEPDHPLRVPGLTNLMAVLKDAKRYEEADKCLDEVSAILAKNGAAVSWRTIVAFHQQAVLLRRGEKRFDESLRHAQAMRDAYFGAFGQYHENTLAGEVYVLNGFVDAGRPEDAWKHVETIGRDPWPPGSDKYWRMSWHGSLAEILLALGRRDEARSEMEIGKFLAEPAPDGTLDVSNRLAKVMQTLDGPAATQPMKSPTTQTAETDPAR
jgi:tetratricopeptide (TPR) repeat protein